MTIDDEFEDELDEHEQETADDTGEVSCPYCGELVEIALDPGGGAKQEYIEDCQVCCRPMRIVAQYRRDGSAAVTAEAEDDEDQAP